MTLRVLFVINGLGTGGAERSIAEMLPGLGEAGVTATVACLKRRPEGVQQGVIHRGADVRFLRAGNMATRAAELRRIIRILKPDIVHTTLFDSNLAGRLAAAGTPGPVLTSLVNTDYDPVRRSEPGIRASSLRVVQAVDSVTARHLTGHFHAITSAVKDAAVRDLRIAPDSVTVIERGRDPHRLGLAHPDRRRRARAALGIDQDAHIVVNVGRQEYQKGQSHLLRAVAALQVTHPRLVALIAGRRGDATTELESLRDQLGLGGIVRFLGHREDVPELLAAADVFVFPSIYEGLGGAAIEAMALGLPVVASDVPALREVLQPGANALLVPPASASELARAVAGLLDDPVRARAYGARSREIFEERFTLDRSTARMADLYFRLARRGRAAVIPSAG